MPHIVWDAPHHGVSGTGAVGCGGRLAKAERQPQAEIARRDDFPRVFLPARYRCSEMAQAF
jgi:hypothetical protein